MQTQYIGSRYVPLLYTNPDDNTNNWKSGVGYEFFTIVTYNDDSYTSKRTVPPTIGNPADNSQYWVKTGNFNAALVALQNAVSSIENSIDTLEDVNYYVPAQTGDSSSAIRDALIENGKVILQSGVQYTISNPIELRSDYDVNINGAILLLDGIDHAFAINASGDNWVTNIHLHDGLITGNATDFVKINGGKIALSEFYNIKHIASEDGNIERMFHFIVDSNEPSKIRIYNIEDHSYNNKYIVYVETSTTSPAISALDGLDLSFVSMWCNVNGGAILKCTSRTMIHFSNINNLYLGGQADDLNVIDVYYLNNNPDIYNIFAEYNGDNNNLLKAVAANYNNFTNLIMFVHSEVTNTGCLIFNGVAVHCTFDTFAYNSFAGDATPTYPLFLFDTGSRDNYTNMNVATRYHSNNKTKLKGLMPNAPLFTDMSEKVYDSTGFKTICTFGGNDLGIGDQFSIKIHGRITGSGYTVLQVLHSADLSPLCQVSNSTDNEVIFNLELDGSLYTDSNNVNKMMWHGASIASNDTVPTKLRYKEFNFVGSFGVRFYVQSLAAGATITIDSINITPISKAVNS